jgi:2-oxoglutarate ferredoxin oxidoreductase subunit alpha
VPAPEVIGPANADVTLIGWGSTYAAIMDALPLLEAKGIKANYLPIKWLVPLHTDKIAEVFAKAKKTIMVENNHSGQFARYMRSETGLSTDGHIRTYDGEPFQPHHIVDGVVANLKRTTTFVPYQEIVV